MAESGSVAEAGVFGDPPRRGDVLGSVARRDEILAVLRELDENLWVGEARLRYLGVQMGRRMTVIRLTEGGLLVHSPMPLGEELRGEFAELGPVRYVVPASNLHGHLDMEQYAAAYPEARLFAAPGLADKRTGLCFDGELSATSDPAWADDLDQVLFDGHRLLDEVEFFHRASRTLIAGDLIFNIGYRWPLWTRLFVNGPRLRRRVGPTPLFRSAVRDKGAARRSVDRILRWEFERVLPGHGDVIETGGHQAVEEGFDAWLPPAN